MFSPRSHPSATCNRGPTTPVVSVSATAQTSSGALTPNLFWTAASPAQIRTYVHLHERKPSPIDANSHPVLHRYIDQDSAEWSRAHRGVLTTGRINIALGLGHASVPFRTHAEGLGALAAVYDDLLSRAASKHALPPEDLAEQLMDLEDQRSKAHVLKLQGSTVVGAGSEMDMATKFSISEQVAARGSLACKLFWGSVQEGAALHSVSQIFPYSAIEQVGLMRVQGALDEQASADPGRGTADVVMPAMGASPDALIRHILPVTQKQVAEAHRRALRTRNQRTAPNKTQHAAVSEAEAMEAAIGLVDALVSLMPLGPFKHTSLGPPDSAHPQSPSEQNSLDPSQADHGPAWPCTNQWRAAAAAYGTSPLHAPVNEHSLCWLATQILACNEAGGAQRLWQGEAHIKSRSGSSSSGSSSSGGSGGGGSSSTQTSRIGGSWRLSSREGRLAPYMDEQGTAWLEWREVVEVKNHCPFQFRSKKTGRGGQKATLSGNQPFRTCLPMWMPQLQLHCLASQTRSALLISRTPNRGLVVFRVKRNDAYISNMLAIIQQISHLVLKEGRPASHAMFDEPQLQGKHQELLAQTQGLAKGASLLKTCHQASSCESTGSGLTSALMPAPGADPHAFFSAAPRGSHSSSKGKKKSHGRR